MEEIELYLKVNSMLIYLSKVTVDKLNYDIRKDSRNY